MYKRFVEIGRVALINEGPDQGKLCVIIDVVDQRRVSADWASGGHTLIQTVITALTSGFDVLTNL